jgi:anti-anti-sigma factor
LQGHLTAQSLLTGVNAGRIAAEGNCQEALGMRGSTPFRIEEIDEDEGVVRLSLVGELDLSTKNAFQRRLCELRSRHAAVRLDLSRLEFIDASGLEVLIAAVNDAQWRKWRLKVDRELAPQVARVFAAFGLELPY